MSVINLLISFAVVISEIYIVVWLIAFVVGLFSANYRWTMYPAGSNLPGSIGSLIVAIAIVIVLGSHSSYNFL